MGKKNKKKRKLSAESTEATEDVSSSAPQDGGPSKSTPSSSSKKKKNGKKPAALQSKNPLRQVQSAFLKSLTDTERDSFFSSTALDPERRAEIWMKQADVGEEAITKYAWATPDSRALAILQHFSPLIEIGCGANAYWCRQMVQTGKIDVVGYDLDPNHGGTIIQSSSPHGSTKKRAFSGDFVVQKGGPEVLGQKKNAGRTLFLCYPDEEDNDKSGDADDPDDEEGPTSMGLACLNCYKGEYVIHVGELFRDASLSLEQAPWGRSSSPEFQVELANRFHCILSVGLPNWLHGSDCLTVWKRSETCTLVFAADEEDDEDEDEEIEYRHVPVDERLPRDVAAPCLQHLLAMPRDEPPVSARSSSAKPTNSTPGDALEGSPPKEIAPQDSTTGRDSSNTKKKKRKKKKNSAKNSSQQAQPDDNSPAAYECPW